MIDDVVKIAVGVVAGVYAVNATYHLIRAVIEQGKLEKQSKTSFAAYANVLVLGIVDFQAINRGDRAGEQRLTERLDRLLGEERRAEETGARMDYHLLRAFNPFYQPQLPRTQ